MLIVDAEIPDRGRVDVRIERERIASIAPTCERLAESEVPDSPTPAPATTLRANGCALLPGLWDHHIHLLSLAAALTSVRCGPPDVRTAEDLHQALRRTPGSGWIRGIGYHESVAGELDRHALDAWVGNRPVRVQHRSGRLWMLSSAACAAVGLADSDGRIFDADVELRSRLGHDDPPDLAAVGRLLAGRGVVGVTDATFNNAAEELALFSRAIDSGALPQRLRVMGRPDLPIPSHARIARGEVKIVLHEDHLPDFDALVARIHAAHSAGRGVAVHCVTATELIFTAAALTEAGALPGDRIEHASVAPPDALKHLAELQVAVVTQPGFVAERGDAYVRDVDPRERDWLYRGRGFLEAGIPLGGGTDAPFASPDPWRTLAAAVSRTAPSGVVLAPSEALTPEESLRLFSGDPDAPGGAPRKLAVGAPADLCLLDRPWSRARSNLADVGVRATFVAGEPVYLAND